MISRRGAEYSVAFGEAADDVIVILASYNGLPVTAIGNAALISIANFVDMLFRAEAE